MATPELTLRSLSDPTAYFSEYPDEMIRLGADAFGREPDDFAQDMEDHFTEAEHGHVIEYRDEPVGFALYRSLEADMLWLQGIAIDKAHQGTGIGVYAVRQALSESRLLVATTRNPATVKLIGKVTTLACPDIRLADPLEHFGHEDIQQAFAAFGPYVNADPSTTPYLIERYPDGLYGVDPGVNMPLPTIAQNARNATMVVGIK